MSRTKPARRLAVGVCLLVGALSSTSGCGEQPADSVARGDQTGAIAAVSAVLTDLERARRERDLTHLLERFDPDVLVLPPDDELLEGSTMLRAWLDGDPGRLCPLRAPADATGEAAGEWAYLTWSEEARGGVVPRALRVLVVLHHEPEGGWRVKRLVWNHGPLPSGDARG